MIKFHIISIFPEAFNSYFNCSIIKRAQSEQKIEINFYNPKNWASISNNPELTEPIDDKPFGGGPGMVLKAEPFLQAIDFILQKIKKERYHIFYFAPRAEKFNTHWAKKIVSEKFWEKDKKLFFLKFNFWPKEKNKNIILVCGRYEGIDSRVQEFYPGTEISIGDYVLTGGELPAMVFVDSLARQIPGVLGNQESLEEERISAGKFYTRPAILKWKNKEIKVPEVLLSGNHKKIEEWKKENS